MTDENNKEDLKIEELEKKLEECQKLRDEYLAGWQRSRADFLNYKKEEMERMEKLGELVRAEMILKILKILDNFERATRQNFPLENLSGQEKEKVKEIIQGFLQIKKQFEDFLKEEKIEEIKAEGEKFDPNFQEVVEQIEVDGKETGQIIEVIEKGYLLNDQLLRPVKVKVAK